MGKTTIKKALHTGLVGVVLAGLFSATVLNIGDPKGLPALSPTPPFTSSFDRDTPKPPANSQPYSRDISLPDTEPKKPDPAVTGITSPPDMTDEIPGVFSGTEILPDGGDPDDTAKVQGQTENTEPPVAASSDSADTEQSEPVLDPAEDPKQTEKTEVTNTAAPDSEDVEPNVEPNGEPPDPSQLPTAVPAIEIATFCQHPDYPTGCESVALYIYLTSLGIDTSVDSIIELLPKGDLPYVSDGVMYGPDPDREFIGDPKMWNAYGVFNRPIADVANKIFSGAIAVSGLSVSDVERIISTGPVVAWVSTAPQKQPKLTDWIDPQTGNTVTWISGEHAVMLYGVTENGYKISNPTTGKCEVMLKEDFEVSFLRYGGKVVYYPIDN